MCRKGRHCDLSHGIVTDAHLIVFHLRAPEPEFLQRLALPFAFAVPRTTPHNVATRRPLPATGPYVIAKNTSSELRLVRNPYFHEWSQAARPDGYPDEIVMKIGPLRGGADNSGRTRPLGLCAGFLVDRIDEVMTRYATQLQTHPLFQTNFLIMNAHNAPFNSADARKAVSYALDRRQVIRLGSDPRLAQPTCQILPRNFPGYVPYCPFSANASKACVWGGPIWRRHAS